jgi:DNA-binding response OmpR family regulator
VRQQRTILVVEPDLPLRESWRSGLAAMGFHVRESTDAGGALSMAMRSQIDLLITELYLATPAERCLVRAIRREPALRHMKILVVSDHASDDDRNWALAAGADAYLVKPVRLGRMLQVAGRLAMSRERSRGEVRAHAGGARIDQPRVRISGGRRDDIQN